MATTPSECQICLDTLTSPYLLECTHTYWKAWIKGFWASQKKRKITPSCPLCQHEIKKDWLEGMDREDLPPIQRVEPPPEPPVEVEFNNLPILEEEEQKRNYFCPSCQQGEGVVDYHNGFPTKATCGWGFSFWIDWYQQWGEGIHHCVRQSAVNEQLCNSQNNIQNHEVARENIECPHWTVMVQAPEKGVYATCHVWEAKFCKFWCKKESHGHQYDPFKAWGLKYRNHKDDYWLALSWYLFIDMIVYPQVLLVWPFLKKWKAKPKECGEYLWVFFLLILVAAMSCLALFTTWIFIFFWPCWAVSRYKALKQRREPQTNTD